MSDDQIIYIPPEEETIFRNLLKNLEDFMHSKSGLDDLVRLAVMYYQFEAIHPFTDDKGRTGRIFNFLYLVYKGLLDTPILYLSRYIIANKNHYYKNLREVTEKQDWEGWIMYMLKRVEENSNLYTVGFPKNRTVHNSNLLTLNSNCHDEKQQI